MMKDINKYKRQFALITLLGSLAVGCESFLEVDPPNSRIITETVYKSDETAIAAVIGMYHQMMANSNGFASGYFRSATLLSGLSSDELNLAVTTDIPYYEFNQNNLTIKNGYNYDLWSSVYEVIYLANSVIKGLANSVNLKQETRLQLEGEAKFIRAFSHFYLVNLYGDVPLAVTTDYRINSQASRTSIADVYEQIVQDLTDAKELLNDNYVSEGRVRPNKAVATAMLARVYLYLGDWLRAEDNAKKIIDNTNYNLVTDLSSVFLAGSSESIWQMIYPFFPTITNEGMLFILSRPPNGSTPVTLSSEILDSFEPGDVRQSSWVGSYDDGVTVYYYPYKYKNTFTGPPAITTEYSMVLRLAEQYLIRAEARAQQGNLPGAIADLDAIRDRAGLPLIADTNPDINQSNLLLAIEQERKVELFTEWGHRWLDLKRTGRADAILAATKPGWDATDVLYPIPEQEMLNAPNLEPQNPGY